MAGSGFDLEIISPEGSKFRGRARSLRLPGIDGGFGILAGHAPMIAALDVGVLHMVGEDGSPTNLAVGDGFVEVYTGGVRVLADFADDPEKIDSERSEEALQRAKDRLSRRSDPKVDAARAEASLRRAMMRLKVKRRF